MTTIEKRQSPFDAIRREDEQGEYWMARDLQELLGYSQWRRFNDTINRARVSVAAAGGDVRQHFSQVSQLADAGNLGNQNRSDFRMTRYGCYLVAMNGDTSKREIADAQQYFAVKTRQAEVAEEREAPAIPQTFQDALRAYADALDEKERAEVAQREAEMEAALLRPPAEAWENLVDTGQDYDVATAANILNRDSNIDTGRNRLFQWMQDSLMLYRRAGGQLVPYANHTEHLRLKPQSRPDHEASDSRARKEAHAQVRVTVRGLEWIQQRMREEARPDLTQIAPPRRQTGNVISMRSAR
jgi:DNA-damage-inducible protein D